MSEEKIINISGCDCQKRRSLLFRDETVKGEDHYNFVMRLSEKKITAISG